MFLLHWYKPTWPSSNFLLLSNWKLMNHKLHWGRELAFYKELECVECGERTLTNLSISLEGILTFMSSVCLLSISSEFPSFFFSIISNNNNIQTAFFSIYLKINFLNLSFVMVFWSFRDLSTNFSDSQCNCYSCSPTPWPLVQ